jgi:hypothetical protein
MSTLKPVSLQSDTATLEELRDIRSRRRREVANLVLQYFVALGVLGTVAYCLYMLTHVVLKDNNNNAFLMILGSSLSWMGVLLSFCFPSSIGSQKSQEAMHQMLMQFTQKVPPPTGAALEAAKELKSEEDAIHAQPTSASGQTGEGQVGPSGSGARAPEPLGVPTDLGDPATSTGADLGDSSNDVDYAPTRAGSTG